MGNRTESNTDSTSNAIEALRPRFLNSLHQRRKIIERVNAAFKDGTLTDSNIAELATIAHKLRGSAASYLYSDISAAAAKLENQLKLEETAPAYGDVVTCISELLRHCDAALKNVATPDPSPVELPPLRACGPAKILLVEDDVATQAMIKAIVKNDASATVAETIEQAIDELRTERPDLIIADNNLACGGAGLDLIRQLRTIPDTENIPVIMLTASSEPEDHIRAMLNGVIDFVKKPIVPAEFALMVRNFLHAQQFTVLIADDNDDVRTLLVEKFREQAVNAVEAASSEMLARATAEHAPDLILLECAMPGADLQTVIRASREVPKETPAQIVLLTAIQNESEILEMMSNGAADYIAKPFNADIVVARAMRLIGVKNAA